MRCELDDVEAGARDRGRVEAVLQWIVRKRLQAPAALLLEMHRAFVPLAWPIAMLLSGVLAPLFGQDYHERIEGLRDPSWLDRILKRLESREDEGNEA